MKQLNKSILVAVSVLSFAIAGCGGGGGSSSSSSGPTDPNQVSFDTSAKVLEPITGGTMSTAVAINDVANNTATVVGISSNATQQMRAAKWSVNSLAGTVGAAVELSPLTGFNFSAAYGINALGLVVGESESANNSVVAAYWGTGTTATALFDLVAGKNSSAYGISASGRIVGEAVNGTDKIVPVYWSSSSVVPVALGTIDGTGVAYAIVDKADGSSIIVGESGDHAVRWKVTALGVVQALEDMGVLTGHTRSVAMGVNKSGVMVGESEDASGVVHAVIFKDKTLLGVVIPGFFDLIDLGAGSAKSSASAINDNSSIAGWSNDTVGSSLTSLWLAIASPASTVNTSLSGSGGNGYAFGINTKNYIVGVKSDKGFVAIPK
jgi:hypothetical protein